VLWKQGTGLFFSFLYLAIECELVPRIQAERFAIGFRLQLYCVGAFGSGVRAAKSIILNSAVGIGKLGLKS
jgi:hypothetical protein